MKNFWIGVASTLLAGILLFFVQDQYTSWKKANESALTVRIEDDLASFNADDIRNISKADVQDTRLATIAAKNTGAGTLANPKLYLDSSIGGSPTIYAYGPVPMNVEPSEPIKLEPKNRGFEITLPILEPGKTKKYWIVYRCCEIFRISSETPGLKITQSVSDYDYTDDDSFLWWVKVLGLLGFGFIFGAILDSKVTTSMLRNRGENLAEILKRPVVEKDAGTPSK